MTMTDPADDNGLEAFFASARAQRSDVPGDLMARILADGLAGQEARLAVTRRPVVQPAGPGGLLRSVIAALGGWPAVTGLASATLAGVWIGFSPPASVASLADGVFGTSFLQSSAEAEAAVDQVDLLPGFDGYLTEG